MHFNRERRSLFQNKYQTVTVFTMFLCCLVTHFHKIIAIIVPLAITILFIFAIEAKRSLINQGAKYAHLKRTKKMKTTAVARHFNVQLSAQGNCRTQNYI